MLTKVGFQVPVIPLIEVLGKTGAAAPLQIGAIAVNVGVVEGLTVIVKVVHLHQLLGFVQVVLL